jgi:hypothetical protein
MCFNKELSLAFSVIGTVVATWLYVRYRNLAAFVGVMYFVLMEFLQYVQYLHIDQCDTQWNRTLTVLGFLHICYQPFFTHLLNGSVAKSEKRKYLFAFIRRLSLISGSFMFARYLLADESNATLGPSQGDVEWVRGRHADDLCTYKGNYHLAWKLPLAEPTYYIPSNFIHFFMMHAPFFAMELPNWIPGLVLYATGPLLASYITSNLHEQASIWCFFSIAQVTCASILLVWNNRGSGHPPSEGKKKQKAK